MRCVRILGTAPNLADMPPLPASVEAWPSNDPRNYRKRHSRVVQFGEWTRWFNLHSRTHMETTYPKGFQWYLDQDGSQPIYTQKFWPDVPGCVEFPRQHIQDFFDGTRFFTFTASWLIAFAILEGFDRIELWGFQLSDRKQRDTECYQFERPCFFYWVKQARDRGIEVWYQPEVDCIPFIPGNPLTYTGPLYGYDTKSEPEWNPVLQRFETRPEEPSSCGFENSN